MNWVDKLERHYSDLQIHDVDRGLVAVTSPDDNRIALVTANGRVILTKRMLQAVCKNVPTIMELFAKP